MKSKIFTLIAVMLGIALVAAACGSDSDDDQQASTPTTAGSTATTAGSTPTTARATATTAGSTPTTAEGASTVGSDGCTEDRKGGELNFGIFSETSGLDPTVSTGSGTTGANELSALYGTLVLQDIVTGEYYPWLAESLEPNDAFDVWTLTLRDDLTFGNGDKVTTTHVRDSMLRFISPDRDPRQRNSAGGWVAFIQEYNIMDDLTIEFVLDAPWAGFPYALADESGMVINTSILEERGLTDFITNPTGAGAGPYEFESFAPGEQIVLKAKDDWWGGPVCIETLNFKVVPGESTKYEAWQNDELQGIFIRQAVPIAEARENGDDNAIVFVKNLGGVALLNNGIRGADVPTADVRIRRAIALALDPDIVNDRANEGQSRAYKSLIRPESIYYDEGLFPPFPTDPETAKLLVEEVKAEGEWDGTIQVDCYPDRENWALTVEALLESVGFDVTVDTNNTIQSLVFDKVFIAGSYNIACWGFNLAEFEGLEALLQFTCARSASGSASGHCDESGEFDAAVQEVRVASTAEEFTNAYGNVWKVWQETMPSVPLNLVEEYVLFQDNIKGILGSQASIVLFHEAYIE